MSLPDRQLCQYRLRQIFPEDTPQRNTAAGPPAAAAVFVCLYVGAIDGERKIRPSTVLWMCDEAARREDPAERDEWFRAALRGHTALIRLLDRWGVTHRPWYLDNSRETLRDETFRVWASYGAILRDDSIATTSSAPQWSLALEFATLFDAALSGPTLEAAVVQWQEEHLGTVGRTRLAIARQLAQSTTDVTVSLPNGTTRTLATGESSLILKGVLEDLAPRLLGAFGVLFLSESRQHVHVVDAALLSSLGIAIRADRLLPDILLFEVATGLFWFIEVVATAGPIGESRKTGFIAWAAGHGVAAASCRFVTAFTSRTSPAFRRFVATLAWDSLVWFLDEPDQVMRLEDLPGRGSGP